MDLTWNIHDLSWILRKIRHKHQKPGNSLTALNREWAIQHQNALRKHAKKRAGESKQPVGFQGGSANPSKQKAKNRRAGECVM